MQAVDAFSAPGSLRDSRVAQRTRRAERGRALEEGDGLRLLLRNPTQSQPRVTSEAGVERQGLRALAEAMRLQERAQRRAGWLPTCMSGVAARAADCTGARLGA